MMRVLFITGLVVLISGCSRVQFAYNQLDWLIPYYVETHIELTDSQDAYLEQRVDALLEWHCSSHLEDYAELLRSANADFQHGTMTEQKLRDILDQVGQYWKEIKQQASPAIAHLLYTSNESQADELFNNFTVQYSEWMEWFEEQTDEELHLDYQKNMTKELERWFGPLQAAQQQAVVDWSTNFEPLGLEGLNARYRWQESLRDLMENKGDIGSFNAGVEQLFVNPEMIYTGEYDRRIEHNTKISIELVLVVAEKLDAGQRKHLASMVESVSNDFDQLACAAANAQQQTSGLHDAVPSDTAVR